MLIDILTDSISTLRHVNKHIFLAAGRESSILFGTVLNYFSHSVKPCIIVQIINFHQITDKV